MYHKYHLILAFIVLIIGQVVLILVFGDRENEHTAIAAQLVAGNILLLYAAQPLKSIDGRADLRSLDSLPKKILPVCISGVSVCVVSPLLLPVGTFAQNPALLDAVVTLGISAALLPINTIVFHIIVILLTRLTRTNNYKP